MTNRRAFLRGLLGFMPASAIGSSRESFAPHASGGSATIAGRNYFEELGIEPFINALAPYSSLGGSQMWPEVIEAMAYAMKHRARMKDLHDAVGKRIASLIGCEAAMVPAGATSAITLGTAACLTGTKEELIHRLPGVAGMKDQVITQKGHRYSYDHAVRNCGVHFVEVETVADLERAIGDRTTMMFFVLNMESYGKIGAKKYAAIGRHHGIPTFIDGATLIPPAENLIKITRLGFDLVCFSGGKGLRGPYSAGLLLGRRDLIEAARANAAPNDNTIGRGMKVSKEELLGMLVAVETSLKHDIEAEKRKKTLWIEQLRKQVATISGVGTERTLDHRMPALLVRWDESRVKLTPAEAVEKFKGGEPSIEVRLVDGVFSINSWCMQPGEVEIVGRRLREILGEAS